MGGSAAGRLLQRLSDAFSRLQDLFHSYHSSTIRVDSPRRRESPVEKEIPRRLWRDSIPW
jgi:hypothetical protein